MRLFKEPNKKSPSSSEIVSKVYLVSETDMNIEMKNADEKDFGYMRVNLVNVKGEPKPFTRSINMNQYQYETFKKDNFNTLTQAGEKVVLVQNDLSKYLEQSKRMKTSEIREMNKESSMNLN